MHCPICRQPLTTQWENSGEAWFAGAYHCRSCGEITMSGSIKGETRMVRSFHPSCPDHGAVPVLRTDEEGKQFRCLQCTRKMEVRNGRLIRTVRPGLGRPAVAAA